MDGNELEVVEAFPCLECGAECAVGRQGDILLADCPRGCRRYALTVAAPAGAPQKGPDPLVGQTVGPCRVMARLGVEGGVDLYGGLDVALNQTYSLLVLRGDAARDANRARDFVRMGKLAAAVRHTALANVTQLGRLPDGLYAIAPALEGKPLERLLGAAQAMPLEQALRVGRRLADALSALHARRIVHRNVGPRTVWVSPDGEPLLRNFAFAVGPGAPPDPKLVVGQAGYIAPELLLGRAADGRADIFSLGALLYLMLTGGPVFPGASPAETLASQKAGPGDLRAALEPVAPPELVELVVGMLAENPQDRPREAGAVLEVLVAVKPSQAPSPAPSLALDEAELAIVEPTVGGEPPQAPEPTAPAPQDKELRDFLDVVSQPSEPTPPEPQRGPAPAAPEPAPAPLSAEQERQLRLAAEPQVKKTEPEPEPEEPERWTAGRKAAVAAGGVVLALILAWFIKLAFLPPTRPPEPTRPRTTEKKTRKKREPTPQERAEANAKVELARLEILAKKSARRPAEVIKQCDAFLEKFGKTAAAAKVRELRAEAQKALREAQAKAEVVKFRALFRDPRITHEQKLKTVADFLARYGDTEAARDLAKQRDAYLAAREAAAQHAMGRLRPDIEANLKASAYGKVISALAPLVAAYRDTKAGSAAARVVAELRARMAADFAAQKDAARQLVRQCRFAEAATKLEPALKVWQAPEYHREATELVALIRTRRAKVVADYAKLLEAFRQRVAGLKFAEALATTRQAAAKADHAAMKALADGLVADAETLGRLPARIAAGARAQAAEAAKTDGRIWLQQRLGKFRALVKAVEDDGIVVEMPGHKGKLTWHDLPPQQLVEFARSAPNNTAEDHRAIGLLALVAGSVEVAYEEFTAAADADPTAVERVRRSLSRLLGGFVHIPGGKFLAGRRNEAVDLPGYLLGAREVTNAEYAFYLKATNRPAPPDWKDGAYRKGYDEFPVVNLTWEEANAYAAWLGARLPTVHEWERAVRGSEGRLYPWGDEFDPRRVNFARKTSRRLYSRLMHATRHFSRHDTSPFFHLLGNAREWTATIVGSSREGKTLRAVVGGSAADDQKALLPYNHGQQEADARDPFTGFRLAWPR